MNKSSIKNFAIWARNKLIADISYRAGLMGITADGIKTALPQSTGTTEFYDIGTAEPYSISGDAVKQRRKLVEVIRQKEKDTDYQTAYKYIIEEVAYTWFNRLIAIRFMEVNDYLPSHMRVLSSDTGKLEPDIVTNPFDTELDFTGDEEQIIMQLKNDNQLDDLFRMLFIKQCNALNTLLPALFEKTKDYTEVLLNLSVIDQEGVIYKLVHDIDEDYFNIEKGGQVEIIGWLYQYYNTEPKAAAFAKNGKITKEEIPAVTQLFTPDWIVRYMVENSLCRLWVEGHPDCGLKENWKYYLEEAQQEPDVQVKLSEIRKEYAALNPEDIKLIDPCMGSGHILVYAFDVLMQIYESAGYSQCDAAKSILEHNLYGLDIDDRAYQLAYFAVMMKARQYNRRILNGENTCHVYAIQESNSMNRTHLKYFGAGMDDIEKNAAKMQMEGLLDTLTDAKEYGSILNMESYNWDLLRRFVAAEDTAGQISMDSVGVEETAEQLNQLIDIGETMARKYWVTCTNPPYAGTSNLSANVNNFVKKNYPDSKADLFAVFIERCRHMTADNGFQAMITQHSWMFLSSFEKLREKIMLSETVNMAHLGARAFEEIGGEVVQTTAFVRCANHVEGYKGTYCRLIEPTSQQGKEDMFLAERKRYIVSEGRFKSTPKYRYIYWIGSDELWKHVPFSSEFASGGRNKTHNNEKYVREWWEPLSSAKWGLYMNGGNYRKWYGNLTEVVNWTDEAKKEYASHGGLVADKAVNSYGISWNGICGDLYGFRLKPIGIPFSSSSPTIVNYSNIPPYLALGLLNTKVGASVLSALNPTLQLNVGEVLDSPLEIPKEPSKVFEKSLENVTLSKLDWNAFETAVDFHRNPLLCSVSTISEAFTQWQAECDERFHQLKANEEELNCIFIDIYGLQDELTPEVADKDVTVHRVFDSKSTVPESMKGSNYVRTMRDEVVSLISYAVGCMFGRYSLDVEGLAYAGGEWNSSKYKIFIPDTDNVIPITDEEYLDDDIVARLCDWLKVVYGADTLEANLDYIAKALGNKGSTSREIIRKYFLNDFFKDHCQTYSVTGSGKRPIYWLFDSGKQNGFKALVYLHRYTPDTIGNLRVDYLHKMQRIYESEINRMQDTIDHSSNAREVATATKRKEKLQKQLKECREYDEKIGHLALSRIELDLDDGVKKNYRKVQTASDGKFYEVLADSNNIMAKEK